MLLMKFDRLRLHDCVCIARMSQVGEDHDVCAPTVDREIYVKSGPMSRVDPRMCGRYPALISFYYVQAT